MSSICFYFHVHQPYRLRKFSVFEIGKKRDDYFEEKVHLNRNNKEIFRKVAAKCYIPTNEVLLELLEKHPEFKISYSITGVFLDQAMEFHPRVLKSFQKLVQTGRVELISETYYHSLAYLYSLSEFKAQVKMHSEKLKELFGVEEPKVFRNTELIFNNQLAVDIEKIGYKGILAEGAGHILGWRSPNFIYRPVGTKKLKALLKNYKLSDDIAFRFSNKGWAEYPLTAEKFAHWVNAVNGNGELVNLFMDYETFGEHQWEDTGIFKFLKHLPKYILKHPDNDFVTPSEAIERYEVKDEIDVHNFISWADIERDLSAWRSNPMQYEALDKIYALEKKIFATRDEKLIETWRRMQTSDHFYYMCTKWFSDGDVHKYFNPYESPYEAFITYMNTMQDLMFRIESKVKRKVKKVKLKVKKKEVSK